MNRQERRQARFGPREETRQDNLRPPAENDAVAGRGRDDEDGSVGRPGQDTRPTGAGTGGATESDDRMSHHEGTHFGNQPNS